MKTVVYGLCDKCGKEMKNPNDGLLFHGNVYVFSTDSDDRGGLIGNNFPEDHEWMSSEDIHETCYCNECSIEVLFGDRMPWSSTALNNLINGTNR